MQKLKYSTLNAVCSCIHTIGSICDLNHNLLLNFFMLSSGNYIIMLYSLDTESLNAVSLIKIGQMNQQKSGKTVIQG